MGTCVACVRRQLAPEKPFVPNESMSIEGPTESCMTDRKRELSFIYKVSFVPLCQFFPTLLVLQLL